MLAGLLSPRKRLPCRLLYDPAGAELFTKIAGLDAYYLGRAEQELVDDHLPAIAQQIGIEARVIEPGAGDGQKPRKLLRALERPSSYVAIDVAHDQLQRAAGRLRTEFPDLEVQTLTADYTQPFELPVSQHNWRNTMVFFPGSTIGNFEPGEARAFLAMLGRVAGDRRMLLLGADSTREPAQLQRAYDDEAGVTAAFNKNVLEHVNRTHGATFDADSFEHRAVWNASASRVEMHLVSKCRQLVRVAGRVITFAPGEPIVTEHCYKHSPEAMQAILGAAGWRTRRVFTGSRHPYRLWLCEPM
ncbi:MAG TPA: L-histidine N(alpha)-methyltransferase [Kofleriaceae bacterium]